MPGSQRSYLSNELSQTFTTHSGNYGVMIVIKVHSYMTQALIAGGAVHATYRSMNIVLTDEHAIKIYVLMIICKLNKLES